MVRRKSFADMPCAVAQALEVVGDPWTLLVVHVALAGCTRFDQFQGRLGIPRTTLASRLTSLVENGLMERSPYQEQPVRHEYLLTTRGRDLRRVIVTLMQWGDRWTDPPGTPTVLVDAETGAPLDLDLVDVTTGRSIDEIAVDIRTAGEARVAVGASPRP